MGTHVQRNQEPNPGDSLRDLAADYISTVYGEVKTEQRASGKKVDVYFEKADFGSTVRIYVECKDESKNLTRSKVNSIWADYEGILRSNEPASLLLITRVGLSPDGQAYIAEKSNMRHQTIWEIENHTLDLISYQERLSVLFDEDSLSDYYVPARALQAHYSITNQERTVSDEEVNVFEFVKNWVEDSNQKKPIAVLAGYGAGKTSFAKRVASYFSHKALQEPNERRVIYIKLGDLARAATLENLLGGMFTSKHKIPNFDFDRFSSFNNRGRFLIILDGFDEMKHAMSWNDFKYNASELNKLVGENSKILLLGRPSAFMSEEEHLHVLRGIKKTEGFSKRLPNWPEYQELEICEFTQEERRSFIEKYTPIAISQLSSAALQENEENRISQLVRLSDSEPGVFSKPVHLKILTEIAADPNIDLLSLETDFSKWKLYKLFIDCLIDREMSKTSRKDLSKGQRQEFLRNLCEWLWIDRQAQTSFGLASLPFNYEEDELRELLIGAMLEKKDGDNYYFAHRSFPEFILAERIVINIGQPSSHSKNSNMFTDGVQSFLEDGLSADSYIEAFSSLSSASGEFSFQYITFLIENNKSNKPAGDLIAEGSVFSPLVSFLEIPKSNEDAVLSKISSLFDTKSTSESQLTMLMYVLMIMPPKSLDSGDYTKAVLSIIIGSLLKIIFSAAGDQDAKNAFAINDSHAIYALSLLKKITSGRKEVSGERHLTVNAVAAVTACAAYLENIGLKFDGASAEYFRRFGSTKSIPLQNVLTFTGSEKGKVLRHLQYNSSFNTIAAKTIKKRKRLSRK